MSRLITICAAMMLSVTSIQAAPKSVFLYAGQSNADGREYTNNLPDYMLDNGSLPSSPYTHLRWASICSNPSARTFGTRTFNANERYAFCDVTNYWIDRSATQDFYAIKCAYGGTAIAPGVTADKLPIWYADAEWMKTHYAYKGDDITQEAYKNHNSLTKNLTEGFASLVDGTLSALDDGYDVKAILWHQGESDRKAAGSYYENFKTMIAYMRQAVYEKTGDPSDLQLPFIFGTICHRSTQYNSGVEKAQLQVAKDVPNVYYIDMSDVTLRSDNLHFDGPATEYLGKMMYNKLVELQLVDGSPVEAVKPKPDSNTDVEVKAERAWDFTQPWSSESVTQLQADEKWAELKSWGYRYSGSWITPTALQTSSGYQFPEAKGLFFTANANRATIDPGKNIGLYSNGICLIIPKVKPGQYVTIEAVTANSSKERGVTCDTMSEPYLDCIQGGQASYSRQKNVWWYRDTFAEPQDMYFCCIGGGVFIYKVMVSDASPIQKSGLRKATSSQQFQQEFGNPRKAFVETIATPNHADSHYQPGQEATLRVVAREGGVPVNGTMLRYKVGPEMLLPQDYQTVEFVNGEAIVRMGTMQEPGFLACQYEFVAADGKTYKDLVKVAFAPEQIKAFTILPFDFRKFWQQALKEARKTDLQPEYRDVPDATNDQFETKLIRLHVSKDKWIQGYLTRPLTASSSPLTKKYPVVLCPPGAGSQKIYPSDYFPRQGCIYLKIEIHDNDQQLPDDEYNRMRQEKCDGYMRRGMADRDTYYYKDVYVGCARAVDFLCSLPEWDGQNVIVTGGSQGGALTIITAALNERVTLCAPFYPALCDLTGFLHQRAGGWPKFFSSFYKDGQVDIDTDQALKTLQYFDVVNFARMLTVPTFMSWGYSDDTCSPTSIWAAWNVITAPKEKDITPSSGHWRFPNSWDKCWQWMKERMKE